MKLSALHNLNCPAPLNKIAAFEKELSINLPEDYRNFLANYNGGEVHHTYVAPDSGADLRSLFGIDATFLNNDLSQNRKFTHGWVPRQLLPIGDDCGGKKFCLDITNDSRGYIFYCDWEPEATKDRLPAPECVADSFTDFIEGLELECEDLEVDVSDVTAGVKAAFQAIFENDSLLLRKLLAEGIDPSSLSSSGMPLLHYAAWQCRLGPTATLIELGADVQREYQGWGKPLKMAICGHCWDSVKLLLENGADINAHDSEDASFLHEAISCHASLVAGNLIDFGVNTEVLSPSGMTVEQNIEETYQGLAWAQEREWLLAKVRV